MKYLKRQPEYIVQMISLTSLFYALVVSVHRQDLLLVLRRGKRYVVMQFIIRRSLFRIESKSSIPSPKKSPLLFTFFTDVLTVQQWNRALDRPWRLVPVRLLFLLQIRPLGMLVFDVLQCLLMTIPINSFHPNFSHSTILLNSPTNAPSMSPSLVPSPSPSVVHSQSPSYMPSQVPSLSSSPSAEPSFTPTSSPTTPVSADCLCATSSVNHIHAMYSSM